MKTYAEREVFTTARDLARQRVARFISRVSNHWGNELRCHELARAVLNVIEADKSWGAPGSAPADRGLRVVDGLCAAIHHSWLTYPDGVVLDVYTPGRLPSVQLVDPFVGDYIEGTAREDIDAQIVAALEYEMTTGLPSQCPIVL